MSEFVYNFVNFSFINLFIQEVAGHPRDRLRDQRPDRPAGPEVGRRPDREASHRVDMDLLSRWTALVSDFNEQCISFFKHPWISELKSVYMHGILFLKCSKICVCSGSAQSEQKAVLKLLECQKGILKNFTKKNIDRC